jgi:membrane protein involved in colicin uptake
MSAANCDFQPAAHLPYGGSGGSGSASASSASASSASASSASASGYAAPSRNDERPRFYDEPRHAAAPSRGY